MPKRSLISLQHLVENAPAEALRMFLAQDDTNFAPLLALILPALQAVEAGDQDETRLGLIVAIRAQNMEICLPVETEAERLLLLAEGKGPTALATLMEQRLSNTDHEIVAQLGGALAVAIWVHANHRRVFDDAVSFRNARVWRDGQFYTAFEVDLDQPKPLAAADVSPDALLPIIEKRLALPAKCGLSVVDLPEVESYAPSVLVIIRVPKELTGIAEHLDNGGRRLRVLRPQKEILLIYTAADQRIEVCADTTAERAVASETFAKAVLGHDVSSKPLTAINYDLSCFFRSLDLDAPDVPGFVVARAALIDIEFRLIRWRQKLRLTVPFEDDINQSAKSFLAPARVMDLASGISRATIAVKFQKDGARGSEMLDITISDRNRCSLLSNRDPILRRFGRALLTDWKIMQPFRDVEGDDLRAALPLLMQLHEEDRSVVSGSFFSERQVSPERLLAARFITRKGMDEVIDDHDDDEEPRSSGDRALYSVNADWLERRVIEALHELLAVSGRQQISRNLQFIGTMAIDENEVPCFLARGLKDVRKYVEVESRLRARTGAGPGIVFCAQPTEWSFIASNMILCIPEFEGEAGGAGHLDRAMVQGWYRTNRGLALGGTALDVIVAQDGESGTLRVPGKPDLPLFSAMQVRCFSLLLAATRAGLPGVRTRRLIEGSGSTGIQQLLGAGRWPVFKDYIEDGGYGYWALKMT